MKRNLMVALVGLVSAWVLAGCSAGMQPEGPSIDQVKAKETALPPDQQIAMIQNAPMPADQKAAKIAEIKAKYGIK